MVRNNCPSGAKPSTSKSTHVDQGSKGKGSAPVFVDVYSFDLTKVFINVPSAHVHHMPSIKMAAVHPISTQRLGGNVTIAELYQKQSALAYQCGDDEERDRQRPKCLTRRLCPEMDSRFACPRGDNCPFVHANVNGLDCQETHVNYLCGSNADVCYATLPTSDTRSIAVFPPNTKANAVAVNLRHVLLTEGSLALLDHISGKSVAQLNPSHCAHFYFNRVCNRGPKCRYLHVISQASSFADDSAWIAPQLELPVAPAPHPIGPKDGVPLQNDGRLISLRGPSVPSIEVQLVSPTTGTADAFSPRRRPMQQYLHCTAAVELAPHGGEDQSSIVTPSEDMSMSARSSATRQRNGSLISNGDEMDDSSNPQRIADAAARRDRMFPNTPLGRSLRSPLHSEIIGSKVVYFDITADDENKDFITPRPVFFRHHPHGRCCASPSIKPTQSLGEGLDSNTNNKSVSALPPWMTAAK